MIPDSASDEYTACKVTTNRQTSISISVSLSCKAQPRINSKYLTLAPKAGILLV